MLKTQRGGRRLALTLSALTPLLAALPAHADDSTQKSSASGFPRSSDTPPVALEDPGDPSGEPWGEANPSGGTQYDTNWVLLAKPGDDDAVWIRVRQACVAGGGRVVDADPSSATSLRKEGWGEERCSIAITVEPDDHCVIQLTNSIRISGAWNLAGNGWNSAALRARALDIYGRVHEVQRTLAVDPTVVETETTSASASATQSSGASGEVDTTDVKVKVGHDGNVTVGAALHDVRAATSGASIVGDMSLEFPVEMRIEDSQCSVRIASAEMIAVSAQAIMDAQTSVDVPYLDIVNIVDAAYVVDPWDDGGPGTPGGEDPPPPTTGGGSGAGTGPSTPSGGDGSAPSTPDEPAPAPGGTSPDDPQEPLPSAPSGDDAGSLPAPTEGSGVTSGGSEPTPEPSDEPGSEPTPSPTPEQDPGTGATNGTGTLG